MMDDEKCEAANIKDSGNFAFASVCPRFRIENFRVTTFKRR